MAEIGFESDENTSEILKELKVIIHDLPEPQQKAIQAILLVISSKKESYKSPMPPPDILKGYNDAIPNGADRILRMVENQSDHRIQIETTTITRELNQSGRGQNYGLIISLSFLAVSAALIYTGHDVAGTFLGTIDLIGLVSVFILGKFYQKK